MTRFMYEQLWQRITQLSKNAKRRRVAVAYLGQGASRLLHLGLEDVLVVDMSDSSVKTGRTDPKEILMYLDQGTRVFSVENLHAKVFVFDDVVVTGSSNVSTHSRDGLLEAAIETTEPRVRQAAIAWIEKELALDPVTPEIARRKLSIYRPPSWGTPRKGRPRAPGSPALKGLWVIYSFEHEFSKEESEQLDKQRRIAAQRLRIPAYSVESIRYLASEYVARECQRGETVIRIHREADGTLGVWPPAKVVDKRNYTLARGTRGVALVVESRDTDRPKPWRGFQTEARSLGLNVTPRTQRQIRDPSVAAALLSFFRTG